MNVVKEITCLNLIGTQELINELDKRADRVLVLMETDTLDKPGMNWLFHANGGFVTRERIIFSLMYCVQNLVKECLGEQNGS